MRHTRTGVGVVLSGAMLAGVVQPSGRYQSDPNHYPLSRGGGDTLDARGGVVERAEISERDLSEHLRWDALPRGRGADGQHDQLPDGRVEFVRE